MTLKELYIELYYGEYSYSERIKKLIEYYMKNTEYKTLYSELREFLLKFKWLYFLEWKIFKKIRMKDVRDFLLIIKSQNKEKLRLMNSNL